MIIASKHLDLDRSVIRVSAEILRKIRKRRVIGHDELFAFLKAKIGDDGDVVIGPAIYFLFLVGRIEYHVKTDAFEYVEAG
jgi:hypothetical protein